jgi:enoyl-CoA hydratase
MKKALKISDDGPVRIIQIDRPDVRNAVDMETARALKDAWLAFEEDAGALVGILTGGEDVFCSGGDFKDMKALEVHFEKGAEMMGVSKLFLQKPTIAAISGYCVAGGLEMACWCDMRIAAESAVFGLFQRKYGRPMVDGGSQRLPHIIGLGRALEMIITGRPVTAEEALEIGLVNEITTKGRVVERAIELAQVIAGLPQVSLKSDKQAVYAGLGKELEEGLLIETEIGKEVLKNREVREGVSEFLNRKK